MRITKPNEVLPALRGTRVIAALGLERDNSNGTSAAISRCGVTAIGTVL